MQGEVNTSLDDAWMSLLRILKSEIRKDEIKLGCCVDLMKWIVRREIGNDLFLHINTIFVETFGDHDERISYLLEHIGLFYQIERRRGCAEPGFEQALAVCQAICLRHSLRAKRLQAGLDNQHNELYAPTLEALEQDRESARYWKAMTKPVVSPVLRSRREL